MRAYRRRQVRGHRRRGGGGVLTRSPGELGYPRLARGACSSRWGALRVQAERREISRVSNRARTSVQKEQTVDSFTSKCVFMSTTQTATLCTDHRHPAHAFQTPRPTKRDSTRSRGGDNGQWQVAVATAEALSFCRAAYPVASSGPGGGSHRLCVAGRVVWAKAEARV